MDKLLYIVTCSHKGELYVPERNVCDMTSKETLRDIASGELDDVVSVIVFNPVEHVCDDVTKEFANAVMNLWARSGEPLTGRQRDFIEQHIGIRAANSFAMEPA